MIITLVYWYLTAILINKKVSNFWWNNYIFFLFNNSNEEILLFCPDNECIVYVNIRSYEYSVIHLTNGLENLVFSTLYEWNDNGLILTTYNNEFYSICVSKKSIKKIRDEEIAIKYTELYKFLQEARNIKLSRCFQMGV